MRPVAEIEHEWDAALASVSDRERMDVALHNWLTISAEHRGHGRIALDVELLEDRGLTSPERFAIAALRDVSRDVDVDCDDALPAILARLCGEHLSPRDHEIVSGAVASLVSRGVLVRTARGGFMERGR